MIDHSFFGDEFVEFFLKITFLAVCRPNFLLDLPQNMHHLWFDVGNTDLIAASIACH